MRWHMKRQVFQIYSIYYWPIWCVYNNIVLFIFIFLKLLYIYICITLCHFLSRLYIILLLFLLSLSFDNCKEIFYTNCKVLVIVSVYNNFIVYYDCVVCPIIQCSKTDQTKGTVFLRVIVLKKKSKSYLLQNENRLPLRYLWANHYIIFKYIFLKAVIFNLLM